MSNGAACSYTSSTPRTTTPWWPHSTIRTNASSGGCSVVTVPALVWVTVLLVAGGLTLIRARDVVQRVVALDLLAVLVIALLAVLSYVRDVGFYFDAAVALSLLSVVATVAAARYLAIGSPFE
jgi:multicomponent Na+:H+ antiporter subunit F